MNDILKEIKRLLENNQIEDAIKFIDKNLKKKQKAGDYLDMLINDLKWCRNLSNNEIQ